MSDHDLSNVSTRPASNHPEHHVSDQSSAKTDVVDVAVAVIHYRNEYLLGFRQAQQHQGARYEFIGGKVERCELPLQALIREVAEEVGVSIDTALINPMGQITHCYQQDQQNSKTVRLHVYRVGLTDVQFQYLQHKRQGEEGQPLCWVTHHALISGEYLLPEANKTILD